MINVSKLQRNPISIGMTRSKSQISSNGNKMTSYILIYIQHFDLITVQNQLSIPDTKNP